MRSECRNFPVLLGFENLRNYISTFLEYSKRVVSIYNYFLYRASINGITITAKATCVQYMSVDDVAVLNQTVPVFVCVFAALFLKEKTTFVDSLIISSCFLGVFFILQPKFFFDNINSSLGVNGQVLANNRNYFLASIFRTRMHS